VSETCMWIKQLHFLSSCLPESFWICPIKFLQTCHAYTQSDSHTVTWPEEPIRFRGWASQEISQSGTSSRSTHWSESKNQWSICMLCIHVSIILSHIKFL